MANAIMISELKKLSFQENLIYSYMMLISKLEFKLLIHPALFIESNDFRIQIVTSTFNHDFMKQFL